MALRCIQSFGRVFSGITIMGNIVACRSLHHQQQNARRHAASSSSSSSSSFSRSKPVTAADFAEIRAAASKSYFEVFRLDQAYDIDLVLLKQRFTQLQRSFHPDNFATQEGSAQLDSGEISSLINAAFKVLHDPHTRGIYLLHLLGHGTKDAEEDEQSASREMPAGFLAEMMTLNEEIDDAEDMHLLIRMRKENVSKQVQLIDEIERAFREEDFDLCHLLLQKLKFHRSMDLRIRKKLP